MDWFGGESQSQQIEPGALPRFPRIWIGYLLMPSLCIGGAAGLGKVNCLFHSF